MFGLPISEKPARIFNDVEAAREICAIISLDIDDWAFVVYPDPKGTGKAILKCHDSETWELIGVM